MESKISKILDHADKLSVIENQKEILLRRFEEDSIFYFHGHQITVTPTLIATVKSYADLNRQTIILLDDEGEVNSFGMDAKFHYMDLNEKNAKKWMLFERFKMKLYGMISFALELYKYTRQHYINT